ncbi:MAG: response regulator [Syntrophothermus sp.]
MNNKERNKGAILIVEDENIVAMNLKMILQRKGYKIAGHARTGQAAIEMAKETAPDLIIMDINLGSGIDGIQAAGQILETSAIPILFATGNSDNATVKRAGEISTDGYLVKPYLADQLEEAVSNTIRKYKSS